MIFSGKYTSQYKWLEEDLPKVNRTETPWLIVLMNSPYYKKNGAIPTFAKPLAQPQKTPEQGQNSYPGVFFLGTSNYQAVIVGIGSPKLYRHFSKAPRQVPTLFRPCSNVFTCVGTALTNSFEDLYRRISGPIPALFVY